ncbi:MAG: hypothetical protein GXO43_08465 [Crenarchaeota archaeon]|nr:hypothetical protein [Thermoproteota archaeon]
MSAATIDLGEVVIGVDDMLEYIDEERRKLAEKYGARNIAELMYLISSGYIPLNDVIHIRMRLHILDEMEKAVLEEKLMKK